MRSVLATFFAVLFCMLSTAAPVHAHAIKQSKLSGYSHVAAKLYDGASAVPAMSNHHSHHEESHTQCDECLNCQCVELQEQFAQSLISEQKGAIVASEPPSFFEQPPKRTLIRPP